jgi:N-methylhydantoinase A
MFWRSDGRGACCPVSTARLFIERARLQRPDFEVTARDASALASICRRLDGIALAIREAHAESVAVCFLHAYVNAAHEMRAKELLQRSLPGVWITTSAEVVPEFREYERFSTTVINAYLLPVMDRYISSLSAKLADAGYRGKVFTMSSGGGIMDLDAARSMPVRTILSGPAGGVAGALWIAKAADLRDFITCDMGGTSTDVCLIENLQAASVSETAFAGYPIKGREVAINTVGAGGGSIAYMEAGRTLQVGPRSAGAEPGPACYGRGGIEPTVTDANVVLGRLGLRLLGGVIRPDFGRANGAVKALADRLGVASVEEMAEGIVRIAVAQMANAIREISIERGYDPSEFVLFPFGGAGPMHGADRRRDRHGRDPGADPAGQLSALGLLASDQRYERCADVHDAAVDAGSCAIPMRQSTSTCAWSATSCNNGFAMRFRHALDMRYIRQAFELTVELPDGARAARAAPGFSRCLYAPLRACRRRRGDRDRESAHDRDRHHRPPVFRRCAKRRGGSRTPRSRSADDLGRPVILGHRLLRARAPAHRRAIRGSGHHRRGWRHHCRASGVARAPRRDRQSAAFSDSIMKENPCDQIR